MSNDEAEYIVSIFRELNSNRDAYNAIDSNELLLYVCIDGKPKPIAYLLSEEQRLDIEVQTRAYLHDNIMDLNSELESLHITREMLEGR